MTRKIGVRALGVKNRALREMYIRKSNGQGSAMPLHHQTSLKFPTDVSPDGNYVAFNDLIARRAIDALVLSRSEGKVIPVAATDFQERFGTFAPDGRWIAYSSDESGREEVYAQRWPPTGGEKWQVSVGGGTAPRWRRNGKELFYRTLQDEKIMSVAVDTPRDTRRRPPAGPLPDRPPTPRRMDALGRWSTIPRQSSGSRGNPGRSHGGRELGGRSEVTDTPSPSRDKPQPNSST